MNKEHTEIEKLAESDNVFKNLNTNDKISFLLGAFWLNQFKDRTPTPSGGIRTETPFYEILNEKLKPLGKSVHSFDLPTWDAILNSADEFHNQFAGDGWISVEDRLPEDAGDVLVGDIEHDIVRIGFYNSSGWYIPNAPYSDVTHWQPLPSPPQNTKES